MSKYHTKPLKRFFSDQEWAKQCERYGFRQYERIIIDDYIAYYQRKKPQKPKPNRPRPARTKTALRNLRNNVFKSWTALKSKSHAMSDEQTANIDLAVNTLIRECDKTEGAIRSQPGRDAEALKVTIRFLNMFMMLQIGKKIKRSDKGRSTQEFAKWFFDKADPELKESTVKNAIKEYLPGWDADRFLYLLGKDEEFNRRFGSLLNREDRGSRKWRKEWLALLELNQIDDDTLVKLIAELGTETIAKLRKAT